MSDITPTSTPIYSPARLYIAGGIVVISATTAAVLDALVVLSLTTFLIWTALSLLLIVPLWIRQSRMRQKVIPCVVILCFVGVYITPWNSRKPFLRDLRQIKSGMLQSEVEQRMSRYTGGTGWPQPSDQPGEFVIPNAIVYRHATTGAFNSDWGVIHLADGRVTKTEFLAD